MANHLIQNLEDQGARPDLAGHIGQLNMGEGKTRVILPMLVLHLARRKEVVRLHFLSQLLGDAYAHLHLHLTASVLNRKIFLLPFNRDVKLTEMDVRVMHEQLIFCQNSRGCVCVAPEHRLSLSLKWHASDTGLRSSLKRLEEGVSFLDILDESDMLLWHKFQLIYAVGTKESLPGGSSRWFAVQALLRILKRQVSPGLQAILGDKRVAVVESGAGDQPQAFVKLRLLPGEHLEAIMPVLLRELATALLDDPPYEFAWITNRLAKHKGLREKMLLFVTDATSLDQRSFEGILAAGTKEMADLLALRGFLAFGLLAHCLQKRHRVGYGSRPGGKKRLAVPYLAADTPSPRSDFGHPDIALTFTTLSYYYDGLSDEQVLKAFARLQDLGREAQGALYGQWYALSLPLMEEKEATGLDMVSKIDLTNEVQKAQLIKHYRLNVETINFWLAELVLPVEMEQYPQRLIANGWHLSDNPRRRPVGFSGTDDNRWLLPLQVHQAQPSDLVLRATNGKMLALLLQNERYHQLEADDCKRPWQCVLEAAARLDAHALIDAGGLVAGVDNSDAATYLLSILDPKAFQGVVFFDTAKHSEWRVRDQRGREWPLSKSPIRERDAFVYFDDSRCRGADMRLKSDAVGMLTLGPGMFKDKLMQAAGRMRGLDKGQGVFLVGAGDVTQHIRRVSQLDDPTAALTSKHVLQWAMSNTVASVAPEGLANWASQGLLFCRAHKAPDYALVDDALDLATLYHKPLASEQLQEIFTGLVASLTSRRKAHPLASDMQGLLAAIGRRVQEFGLEHQVIATGLDEECEREIENEKKVQEETEKHAPRTRARAEVDWDYAGALKYR